MLARRMQQAAAKFPVVHNRTQSNGNASGSAFTCDMPAGIQAGDLLLLFVFKASADGTISTPSGWTSMGQDAQNCRAAIFRRTATGSDGATVTVSYTGDATTTRIMSLQVHAIRGYQGTPEAALLQQPSTTSPRPPSLTPSWGNKNCLWFAALFRATPPNTLISDPAQYGTFFMAGNGLRTGTRSLRAATEHPGAFSYENATNFVSATVAVRGLGS